MADATKRLLVELSWWRKEGQKPRLFLRDDDAICVTPALLQLTGLIERFNIPLLLAVIPKFGAPDLGKFVTNHPLLTPAVHGWAHENHAGIDAKKCEFCDGRDQKKIVSELTAGRKRLEMLFGERLSPLFVPPWNRIGRTATLSALKVGFTGISGFGWKPPLAGEKRVNTHVDIIDWKAGKTGKSFDQLVTEIADNLAISRANGHEPIGVLSHHLVHDMQIWSTLQSLFELLNSLEIEWVDTNH